jgi:nucleoid-associated protein YgaU
LPQQYHQQGEQLLGSGEVDAALERLTTAALLEPSFADTHLLIARVYLKKGLLEEALAQCDIALRLSPECKQRAEEIRQSAMTQRGQREAAATSRSLENRRLSRLVWMLPAVAFGVGLALAFFVRRPAGEPPTLSLSARVKSAFTAHAATRDLPLSVAEAAGVVRVSGVVPNDLAMGLVRELASESAGGSVDFQGLVAKPTDALPAPPPVMYQVQPGDSLWLIAQQKYGNAELWPQIAEANRANPTPARMMVGDRLILPEITIHPH